MKICGSAKRFVLCSFLFGCFFQITCFAATIHFSWKQEEQDTGLFSHQLFLRIFLNQGSKAQQIRFPCAQNDCRSLEKTLENQRSRMWRIIDEGGRIQANLMRFQGVDTPDIFTYECVHKDIQSYFEREIPRLQFTAPLPFSDVSMAGKLNESKVCRYWINEISNTTLAAQVFYDDFGELMFLKAGASAPIPMRSIEKNYDLIKSYSHQNSFNGNLVITEFVPGQWTFTGCPTMVETSQRIIATGKFCEQIYGRGPHWRHYPHMFPND